MLLPRPRRALLAVLPAALLAWLAVTPYPTERLSPIEVQATRIVDREGRLLYVRRAANGGYGDWTPLEDIAEPLVRATLSSEDAGFYDHPGVSIRGIARALWLNAEEGRLAYGGSTLTQQLAGVLEPRPRTIAGKIREADDALRIERTLGKDEILEQYLNRVYYGRGANGVGAASARFFGKRPSELALDEAALLAVLPRGPSRYDPDRHLERAKARRRHVLSRMAERGWVDEGAAREAAEAPIELVPLPHQVPRGRHVLDHLEREGLIPDGAREVRLGIDIDLQERLERRVRMHLADVADRAVDQAGIVVLDNASGEVLAMVGSRRYGEEAVDGAVNVTVAARHPGSALKPFVYALALEAGANPSSPVLDVPTAWKDYRPRAANRRHRGLVSMREALGSSLNVPAVRLANRHGVDGLLELLRRAGLETIDPDPNEHGLALALGGAPVRLLDLAGAYGAIARGGTYLPPTLVREGRRTGSRVLSEETAHLLGRMLADDAARRPEFGFETPLELPFPAAVKTGTSQSFCDNVVVGFTPEITVAVWVGNFDGRPMRNLLSMQGAAPLWRDAMLAAMEGRPQRRFEPPEGIEEVVVCPMSGLPRGPHCPHARREEVARRHRTDHACEWHRPDGSVALPAELRAHAGGLEGVKQPIEGTNTGDSLRILSPRHGARFRWDPVLAPGAQSIPLRAAVPAAVRRVRWEVAGEEVATVAAPFAASWTPAPGVHEVRVVGFREDGDDVVASARITVRGGE